jgi:hypothetical protein
MAEPPADAGSVREIPDRAGDEGAVSEDIRAMIRERIAAGALPCERCRAVWAGPGVGMPCVACGRPILPTEIEFECEQPGPDLLRFHQACYLLWEDECQHWATPPPETVHTTERSH